MIVALHAATGAAVGALTRSRVAAVILGPAVHVAGDFLPHRHPQHVVWEYVGGTTALLLLARQRGVLDPATLGAATAVLPDLEHVVPAWARPQRDLFHLPNNTAHGSAHGLSARLQTIAAFAILGALLGGSRGAANSTRARAEA